MCKCTLTPTFIITTAVIFLHMLTLKFSFRQWSSPLNGDASEHQLEVSLFPSVEHLCIHVTLYAETLGGGMQFLPHEVLLFRNTAL